MPLKIKTLLADRYRIQEVLGQGGMGAVYRAMDENLGIQVAVKENLFTSNQYTRQFTREATILATMRHPNLPRVFDHFEVKDQGQYLVMDYIEGEDLRQRIDRVGILQEKEIIVIGAGICDALEYLHTRHPPIFHRDIKPGNIKINSEGEIYLVDFGLAKIARGSQATTTGARAMTPGYSSPEQYGTARTDARSDVYSLGATIYAALTGSIPEDGLARAMEQADLTPVQKRNPKVGRRLAQVIEKALAIHPEDRYQTAAEFKQGLLSASMPVKRQVEAGEITIIPPPEDVLASIANGKLLDSRPLTEPEIEGESMARKRRKHLQGAFRIASIIITTVIGVTIIGILLSNSGVLNPGPNTASSPSQTLATDGTFTPTTEVKQPTTTLAPIAAAPTLTPTFPPILVPASQEPTIEPVITYESPPDDWMIAFASSRSGKPQIWLYSFGFQRLRQLTEEPNGACQPTWSPDGQRIAYVSPCAVDREISSSAFIYLIDVDNPREPTRIDIQGAFDPKWSPVDGDLLLFTRNIDANNSQVYRINLANGDIDQMTETETNHNFNPAWSRNGAYIAFISSRLAGYRIYLMPNTPGAEAIGLTRSGPNDNQFPDWSLDGEHIIFSQKPSDGSGISSIYQVDIKMLSVADIIDYSEERISKQIVPESDPEYSPNGQWILIESWPMGDNHDIYIMKADGSEKQVIASDPATDFDPCWKP